MEILGLYLLFAFFALLCSCVYFICCTLRIIRDQIRKSPQFSLLSAMTAMLVVCITSAIVRILIDTEAATPTLITIVAITVFPFGLGIGCIIRFFFDDLSELFSNRRNGPLHMEAQNSPFDPIDQNQTAIDFEWAKDLEPSTALEEDKGKSVYLSSSADERPKFETVGTRINGFPSVHRSLTKMESIYRSDRFDFGEPKIDHG